MAPASPELAEYRAGATDLTERRRSGVARGPVHDLATTPTSAGVRTEPGGGLRLGAMTTLAAVADDPVILRDYPGLAAAARGVATPQIRRVATLGGALAQRNRCWYFRNPDIACLKKGGEGCPMREGHAFYAVAFDTAPCLAPHPSTLAAALLAYEARLDTDLRRDLPIGKALGDGRSASSEMALAAGEMIEAIVLPAPVAGERAGYKRAIGRAHAEWPLVELVVSVVVEAGVITRVRLVAGAVAPVPLRLHAAEAALLGAPATATTFAAAAHKAVEGANPPPGARFKLDLLKGLMRDLMETTASQTLQVI